MNVKQIDSKFNIELECHDPMASAIELLVELNGIKATIRKTSNNQDIPDDEPVVVFRIARHIYLDNQIHNNYNQLCIVNLRDNITYLEIKAAERHNRPVPQFNIDIENMICCPKCLHIGCEGNCHA